MTVRAKKAHAKTVLVKTETGIYECHFSRRKNECFLTISLEGEQQLQLRKSQIYGALLEMSGYLEGRGVSLAVVARARTEVTDWMRKEGLR